MKDLYNVFSFAIYIVECGVCNGDGVEQDHEQAFEWLMKPAEQWDYANAKAMLGY